MTFSTITSKLYLIAYLVLFGFIGYQYFSNTSLKNKYNKLEQKSIKQENDLKISNQNYLASEDLRKQVIDSIQKQAVLVSNLNGKNNKLNADLINSKNSYTLLQEEYSILKKDFTVVQTTLGKIVNDTVYVPINGKQEGVKFNGQSWCYIKTAEAGYYLHIIVDSSDVKNILYIDTTNDVVKSIIYVNNNLIKKSQVTIDSLIYLRIANAVIPKVIKSPWYESFYLFGELARVNNSASLQFWNILGADYRMKFSFGIDYEFNNSIKAYAKYSYCKYLESTEFGLLFRTNITNVGKLF